MLSFYQRFCRADQGGTSLEYALIGALISVFIIAAVQGMTGQLQNVWGTVETAVSTATANAPSGK
jgi:Flp pilus assembly pilin Flp